MNLKTFQQQIGTSADGIFGPGTFKAGAEFLNIKFHACAVHFFAQCSHESGNFEYFYENLNYSSSALLSVFGKYFPTDDLAEKYARQPERIANKVYANRMGNGDEESGDGWKYRGRGVLQLTGKNNYTQFSNFMKDPEIIENPEVVAEKYAFNSAFYFFDENNLWSICEEGLTEDVIKKMTRRINGGYNGLDHRIELTEKFSKYSL